MTKLKATEIKKEIQEEFGHELAKVQTNPKSLYKLFNELNLQLKDSDTDIKILAAAVLKDVLGFSI